MAQESEQRIPLDDLLVFHRLARSLTSSLDLQTILRTILDYMERLIQADLWTLLMLEFSAPPALALGVFSQQYGYRMKIIPAACLISYIFCLITVPFFVALAP